MIFHFWAVNVVLLVALSATVVTDLRWRRIPDWITFPAAFCGLMSAAVAGGIGWAADGPSIWTSVSLSSSAAGAVLAGGFFWLLAVVGDWIYDDGTLGSGDIKLFAALGALFGAGPIIGAVLVISVVGGVQGVFTWLAGRPVGRAICAKIGMKGTEDPEFGKKLPYGLSIAAGAALFRVWQIIG